MEFVEMGLQNGKTLMLNMCALLFGMNWAATYYRIFRI